MDEFPRSIRFRMEGETVPFASFPPPSCSIVRRLRGSGRETGQKRFPIFRSAERNLPAD